MNTGSHCLAIQKIDSWTRVRICAGRKRLKGGQKKKKALSQRSVLYFSFYLDLKISGRGYYI